MQNIQQSMMAFYTETASKRGNGGWRAVGEKVGKTGAYARQLANGYKRIPDDIAIAWMDAMGETTHKPARRQRPAVRRPWMGAELSAAMDAAGLTDATVRRVIMLYLYEQELAGQAGEGGE